VEYLKDARETMERLRAFSKFVSVPKIAIETGICKGTIKTWFHKGSVPTPKYVALVKAYLEDKA
jgi:hypothetical protein